MILQSVAQWRNIYGEAAAETFVTNLALRIIYAPKEDKIATTLNLAGVKARTKEKILLKVKAKVKQSDHCCCPKNSNK